MKTLQPGLYIVSTPIGNLDDISLRSVSILKGVDFIVCENPRHSIKLLNKLGIKKKLISLHDYNEKSVIKKLEKSQNISSIALISDAGSPLISDPGYNLVKNYIEKKIFITSLPGPSSIILGLQLSGLPVNNFAFYGFVPKNKKGMASLIKNFLFIGITGIFFVSGKNIVTFLEIVKENCINADVAVCKELTKINENVYRGKVDKIINKLISKEINIKGEFTLLINKKDENKEAQFNSDSMLQIAKLLKKYSLTETVQIVHKLSNISKKEVYKMALKIKNG